ncbi:MAG: hypothetical protein ACM3L6_01050 [Deltaproteobacteria bacterium]
MAKAVFGHRRKIYFIEKQFQTRFILRFCLLAVAAGLVTVALVYLFASRAATVSIVDARVVVRSTADFILPVLTQTVAVVVVAVGLATIALTLFHSHKLAGPLYRFRKVLETLEAGDFSAGFSIRDLDQLQTLADALNGVVARNKERLAGAKEALAALEKHVDEGRLDAAKAALRDVRQKLDQFKTS